MGCKSNGKTGSSGLSLAQATASPAMVMHSPDLRIAAQLPKMQIDLDRLTIAWNINSQGALGEQHDSSEDTDHRPMNCRSPR
jgi:hypothetical protein